MKLIKFLLVVLLVSITFGQLARLPVGEIAGAVNLIDLVLVLAVGSWLISLFFSKQKILFPPGFWPLLIFWLVAAISLVNALKFFTPIQVIIGSLFLWRFVFYSLVYLVVYNSLGKKEIPFWTNLLILVGMVVAFLGILQFLFLSDLRFLALYGWDPHFNRLVSTFLDPNFVGGFLTLTFILLISKMLFSPRSNIFHWLLIGFLTIAIILTFSRSTYLMFFVSLILIGILKSKRLFLALLIFFVVVAVFVPKVQDRIVGAVTFDVTAQARITSWQNALTFATNYPFWGLGFNNYRFAQAKFGLFDQNQPLGGHAGAGSDSSLLTVLATSGFLGLTIFIFIFLRILVKNWQARRDNYLSFCVVVSLISLFFHSQFVNSLLFSLIMVWLWFTIGLAHVSIRDEKQRQ